MTTSKQILADLMNSHGDQKVMEWYKQIQKARIPAKATHKRDDAYYRVGNIVCYWDDIQQSFEPCWNATDIKGWLEELEEL